MGGIWNNEKECIVDPAEVEALDCHGCNNKFEDSEGKNGEEHSSPPSGMRKCTDYTNGDMYKTKNQYEERADVCEECGCKKRIESDQKLNCIYVQQMRERLRSRDLLKGIEVKDPLEGYKKKKIEKMCHWIYSSGKRVEVCS